MTILSLLVIIVEALVNTSSLQRKRQKVSYHCAVYNVTLLLLRLSF